MVDAIVDVWCGCLGREDPTLGIGRTIIGSNSTGSGEDDLILIVVVICIVDIVVVQGEDLLILLAAATAGAASTAITLLRTKAIIIVGLSFQRGGSGGGGFFAFTKFATDKTHCHYGASITNHVVIYNNLEISMNLVGGTNVDFLSSSKKLRTNNLLYYHNE